MGRARRRKRSHQGQRRGRTRGLKHAPQTSSSAASATAVAPTAAPMPSRRELKHQRRQAKKARRTLLQLGGLVLGVALLLAVPLAVLGKPLWGGAAAIALFCLALSFKYPRPALWGFIVLVPFSGTLVYALGGSSILHLAKDVLYFPALVGILVFCSRTRQRWLVPSALKLPLGVLVAICLITLVVVNGSQQLTAPTGDQPILMGLLGLKVLLGYLPLVTCLYYLLRHQRDVEWLLRGQAVLILVCCGLGFLQYLMLKVGLCQGTIGTGEDLFKASLEARCLVGGSLLYSPAQGQIRLPGTFSAPWQWGWFLISGSFFAFATAFSDRTRPWRLVGLAALGAVGIMAVLSGQRIALVLVPLVILSLLGVTGPIANLRRVVPIVVGLGLMFGLFTVQYPHIVVGQWDSFQNRWAAAPPQVFILQQLQWAQNEQSGLLGQGLGRGTNAARIFGETELVETYHPKLLYEIGPLGLLATLALYATLAVATFRAYRSVQDPHLRGYGAALWLFVLFISFFPYYYPLDVNPVNVYYWLAAGVVLKLPLIDQQQTEGSAPRPRR